MEHVVFFPAHDGTPAFRRVATLDEAVRLVEHLRNVEGISEVSCHALTEVPLSFRAWYRVEVPVSDVALPAQPTEMPTEAPADAFVEAPVEALEPVEVPGLQADASEPVLASANGHASDGAKSLGFFA